MEQLGLGSNLSTKKTRKARFLDETECVKPWVALVKIVEPYCPRAKTGCPPFAVETALPIRYLQQWFCLCDSLMEEALHDTPQFRGFVKIGQGVIPLPGATTILQFRHLLELHSLAPELPRVVNDILGVKPIADVVDSSGSTADNGFRDRCSLAEIRIKLIDSILASIHNDGHKLPLAKARSMTSDRRHRANTRLLFCPSFVFRISDPSPKIAA